MLIDFNPFNTLTDSSLFEWSELKSDRPLAGPKYTKRFYIKALLRSWYYTDILNVNIFYIRVGHRIELSIDRQENIQVI